LSWRCASGVHDSPRQFTPHASRRELEPWAGYSVGGASSHIPVRLSQRPTYAIRSPDSASDRSDSKDVRFRRWKPLLCQIATCSLRAEYQKDLMRSLPPGAGRATMCSAVSLLSLFHEPEKGHDPGIRDQCLLSRDLLILLWRFASWPSCVSFPLIFDGNAQQISTGQ